MAYYYQPNWLDNHKFGQGAVASRFFRGIAVALSFRLLSLCPRVSKSNGKLVAATAWRLRILTLGWLYRKVVVDPKRRELSLYRRYFWLIPRRHRVRFERIEAVTYGYQDWALGAFLSWAHDSVDLFSVGLRLHGGDELRFNFYGDGTFRNDGPLPDWLYWDEYLFDMSGTQEKESRAFVELICKMIRVSVIATRS
jgi:hypothetical protein